jgi:mono/diheme cytochrome c family protein
MLKKIILGVIVVAIGGFLLIQLVPFGRDHANPAIVQEPKWDSPATRELAKRACFDCHSNETVWPWYSNIAPVSWLVAQDTYEGRDRLNFSDWVSGDIELDELQRIFERGEMPPAQYTMIHAGARLTDAERQQLLKGLQNSLQ